ncbi:unnamed protein product [Urochloa humidicola]
MAAASWEGMKGSVEAADPSRIGRVMTSDCSVQVQLAQLGGMPDSTFCTGVEWRVPRKRQEGRNEAGTPVIEMYGGSTQKRQASTE